MLFLAQANAAPQAPQLPPLPEGPDLARVRGPIEIPETEWTSWLIAGALLLSFLVFAAWLFIYLRKKPKDGPTPLQLAQDTLATIDPNSSDETFANQTSDVLRRFIEDELKLRFTTRTNAEFLKSLRGNTAFDADIQKDLAELLAQFDSMKFSGASADGSNRIELLDTIGRLIQKAHDIAQQKEEATE